MIMWLHVLMKLHLEGLESGRERHGKEECLVLEMHVNACECMCV